MTKNSKKLEQISSGEAPAEAPQTAGSMFERFRLPQDFSGGGVRRIQAPASIRKPHRTEFFRAHPEDRIQMAALKFGPGGREELYLVDPGFAQEYKDLATLVAPVEFQRSVNLDGEEFIIPKPIPDALSPNRWHQSRFELVALAEQKWVRIVANMSLGLYEGSEAVSDLPEPAWSPLSFADLLAKAFEHRIISDTNHPVFKALRGELA